MKKITYIYLIRHSEQLRMKNKILNDLNTQIANEKIILSVDGEKKAEELSKLEELINIDVLWSSNYVRAISTAKYISKQNDIEINIDKNLNERSLRRFGSIRYIRTKYEKYFYNRTIIR
ncbi:MAG: histidine phosphatase family protein [Clostridia bacterium]|nr:histidine phosphatase family protein [Clostridia bacterium]